MTTLAMLAFAGNSVLCRLALEQGAIDPASFTSIRLLSGAIVLCLLLWATNSTQYRQLLSMQQSTWWGGFALFGYAAGFSFAYLSLPTGTGALILFASVQITMLALAFAQGNRFTLWQWSGFALALIGLVYLLLPGISAPPLLGALLMAVAGIAWGVYSIMGKKVDNPTQSTAENFIRASIITLLLSVIFISQVEISVTGFLFAIASGAITSGLGYAIWYAVLPHLAPASAASLQLTVPVLATIGGLIWLNEALSIRLVLASIAILGGVAMVVLLSKKA